MTYSPPQYTNAIVKRKLAENVSIMKNLAEIKAILGQVKSLLQEKYHISELGIFGDYVKGEVKENSQVNILINYIEPPSLLELVDMEYYLSDLLKIKADVFSKNGLKGKRKEKILSEVIYL